LARYLLAASPLSGHVAPMTRIGRDLKWRGHDVTMLSGSEYLSGIVDAGLHGLSLTGTARLDPPGPDRVSAYLPPLLRRLLAGRAELRSVFIAPLRDQYLALRNALAQESFDAILADIAFTGVLPLLLSDDPRPPIALCGLGPLTLSSRDTPPFGMAWQPDPTMDYRRMTAVAHRVFFGDVQTQFDRALRSAHAGPSQAFVADWVRLADRLLQLSVPGFEYPRSDLPASVAFVGPVLADARPDVGLPPWWSDVLEAPFVVHVTQGTFDNVDLDQLIGPTLTGLADHDDVLVVASTGGRPGQSFRASVPRNARMTDWLPYSALMPHVDVMITNGGYGGVHHALSEAVPVIVAGETSDKAEIGARIEYTRAGINLGTATPSPARIAEAVDRIRRTPQHRSAASRLAAEIAGTTPLDAIAGELSSLCTEASGDVVVA
jgi:UDP:flavonoid glycosyltransferase YjiC (YdhE family)